MPTNKLQKKCQDLLRNKNTAWKGGFNYGAGDKTWTYDLCITNALLYQLSYTGNIGQYILSQKQFQAPVSGFYKINCPRWKRAKKHMGKHSLGNNLAQYISGTKHSINYNKMQLTTSVMNITDKPVLIPVYYPLLSCSCIFNL